ncbi:MAG: hypothetical protein IKG89_04605 [Oscillospiraceae bacterium]|nr:hypothetical protein [Oscillospiraceae bacterium]
MGSGFWKGMGAGLAVGLGMGMLLKPKKKSHAAAKLIRTAGDVVDRVGAFFGV